MDGNEDDDFFGEGSSNNAANTLDGGASDSATWNKVSRKLTKDGYRIGKVEEDARQMQLGFNTGFADGNSCGKLCGKLYACLRYEQSLNSEASNSALMQEIEKLVFEDIPRSCSSKRTDDRPNVSINPDLIRRLLDFTRQVSTASPVVEVCNELSVFANI